MDQGNTPYPLSGGSVDPIAEAPKKKSKKERQPRHGLTYPDDFEAFWEKYPRKTAKPIAFAAYCKVPIQDQLAILIDLDARVNSEDWRKDDGRYIPYPSTYLNQRRWEDQAPVLPGVTAEPAWKNPSRADLGLA